MSLHLRIIVKANGFAIYYDDTINMNHMHLNQPISEISGSCL